MICVGRPTSAPAIVKPQQNGSSRTYSLASVCRNHTRHIQCRGAKSFVDDLDLSRGVVLSRAVALLRSIETKPFDSQICPHFWTDILRASQGRFDPSYNSLVWFVWVVSRSVFPMLVVVVCVPSVCQLALLLLGWNVSCLCRLALLGWNVSCLSRLTLSCVCGW